MLLPFHCLVPKLDNAFGSNHEPPVESRRECIPVSRDSEGAEDFQFARLRVNSAVLARPSTSGLVRKADEPEQRQSSASDPTADIGAV